MGNENSQKMKKASEEIQAIGKEIREKMKARPFKEFCEMSGYDKTAQGWAKGAIFSSIIVMGYFLIWGNLSLGWHWMWLFPVTIFGISIILALPLTLSYFYLYYLQSKGIDKDSSGALKLSPSCHVFGILKMVLWAFSQFLFLYATYKFIPFVNTLIS